MNYQTPGVYIEEFERGPRPIEGLSTSDAAFLGETERGPTKPYLVTSILDYQRMFGGVVGTNKFMPDAIKGFFDNGGQRCYVTRIVDLENAIDASLQITDRLILRARGEGSWGNRVFVRVMAASSGIGFRLRLAYWSTLPDEIYDPFDPTIRTRPRPALVEEFDDLDLDPTSPNFVDKRIGDRDTSNSALVSLVLAPGAAPPALPAPTDAFAPLENGEDGDPPQLSDYVGSARDGNALPPNDRRGLERLEDPLYRDIALVYAPGAAELPGLVDELLTHCELNRFRFAILDTPQNARIPSDLDPRSGAPQGFRVSEYGAVYFPWIKIIDGQTGAKKTVPPGGHVAGIYARSDQTRGVWKAPANETVRGAVELDVDVNDADQGVINPRGVNAIRAFPGRGILVWGARTLASNALWKYINVRRLFIFLEASVYRATQWVVFESNDERLWARVRQTLVLFLRTQWREGAMMGLREEEAFYVKVDRTTMTQDDILNGRLIVEVGIAPVRPAEFVIFRFTQITQAPRQ